ncbi:hypothetical protein ABB37_06700 [Leptomonas pyrrhocoris]|uniref:Stealth protein CR3 conserved region 3 domain-containing protein n=1 Tax=Leptomonas pyrrhocoris TaxID=157538 RepID=A0A0N1J4L7_LEPPY|nr:hypothetical protein ABB37_06700 [Leptomonas pyrrhocoris]KPA77921.1 hypothetical protein ABB37_06700 [Leptomonas pyrrhocoris]|eukprot:XP_015656360.1 hypothetical protein ABB37_06700 [Leptomonas pyrrhocoris]
MLPYSRIRGNREVPESVHVRLPDTLPPHLPPTASRRRLGKPKSTLLSVACGTLFVVAVVTVYVLTSFSNSMGALRVDKAEAEKGSPVPTVALTPQPATGTSVEPPATTRTQIPTPVSPHRYVNVFDRQDTRTARPEPVFDDVMSQFESGEYAPEEPARLPGLTINRRTYTPQELLQLYGNTDYIYSFVNGSEMNHHFRKRTLGDCIGQFRELENAVYAHGGELSSGVQLQHKSTAPACHASYLKKMTETATIADLFKILPNHIRPGIGDRETDELRHSIRSLEQHVQWHRGRVVIVSPGHHPDVGGRREELPCRCVRCASVQALRSRTTVHQDAVMPYGMRLTVDSHVIEQHIWRVRNTTAVHVYMNDDYFVNRDVAITDLFNQYGGTIVRVEKGILRNGQLGPEQGGTWGEGVRHTQLFNIMELDLRHDDYLPEDLLSRWTAERAENHVDLSVPLLPVALNDIVDVAHGYTAAENWPRSVPPRRYRRYATHAPFVYCTNMFRFMQTRYAREFAHNAYLHRTRQARDLYVPFVYNAFVMARPWVASPKFLPYLMQLHRSRGRTPTEAPPSVEIALDNFDSCGQSTLRGGRLASQCLYGKFQDNLTLNVQLTERIRVEDPLYFNINAGFNSEEASNQLRKFLHDKFPTPVYLEQAPATTAADPEAAAADGDGEKDATAAAAAAANVVADAVLPPLFDALMALPVVGVVSYEEGVCPLVRSLSLAFAGHHRGRVHVAVQRYGDGEADETLREARTRLRNRVISATPVLKCAYGSAVKVASSARGEGVADVARRVLQASDGAGVVLPSTCGAGDGGAAGLRVRGFVMDARTPHAPVTSTAALRAALSMPGQTLALEDFRAVRVGPDDRDVVLVLAREDAAAKAVHWIDGASENDLLVTYPLPVEQYENLGAQLQWSQP